MFEDFRKQAEEAQFPDDIMEVEMKGETVHKNNAYFLGLTPVQRFIIALMMLLMIIILGVLFLLVTAKIEFPVIG